MSVSFFIIAGMILVSAIAAISLRELVHAVLCLAVTLTGVAALFLQLGAEFVGFAQILVYVGAVTILILFAILLTRNHDVSIAREVFSRLWPVGMLIGGVVLGSISYIFVASPGLKNAPALASVLTVRELGQLLMTDYVFPLELVGLLLTAALLGGVVIAMPRRWGSGGPGQDRE